MNQRLLLLPESAYHTLMDTLSLDAESTAFDQPLRFQIKRALEKIRELPCPFNVTIHVRGGVAYSPERCPSWLKVKIVDRQPLTPKHRKP